MTGVIVGLTGWLCAVPAAALALLARRVTARRTEHLARAAHELRGPLTALGLGLDGASLPLARSRALELELGRAKLALDDLTAAAGLGVVGMALQPVDAAELLADSVEAWRPVARGRAAEVRLSWSGGGASVFGDRYRLAQATDNLIANAIEHGGGTIEVSGRLDGPRVRIQITDGGPGLPAPVDDLVRRPRTARGWLLLGLGAPPRLGRGPDGPGPRGRGRGRGLAIADQVARDHGGRLAAAPSERGARVILELPVADGGALSGDHGDGSVLS